MSSSRAPWWMYVVAASFLGFAALQIYTAAWGPGPIGMFLDYSSGSLVAKSVVPNGAGERAGLRAGDRIVAADGMPIRRYRDWEVASANFEIGRPTRLEIERGGQRTELAVILGRRSPRDWTWEVWPLFVGAKSLMLVLALVVAFRRPGDPIARIGALFLATAAIFIFPPFYGLASTWRHLPAPLGILLWVSRVSFLLFPGIFFTFFAVFPRTLFRARWAWGLVWTPVVLGAALIFHAELRLVYQPERALASLAFRNHPAFFAVFVCYVLGGLAALVMNYRRLEDVNERRRVRVLLVGINYAPELTGIGPYTAGLAEHLAERGSHVRVVTGLVHYPEWRRLPAPPESAHTNPAVTRYRHFIPRHPSTAGRLLYEGTWLVSASRGLAGGHVDASRREAQVGSGS